MLSEKKINIKISAVDYIRYKQLNWYGHVRIIYEERLPQSILEFCPTGRSRRRRRRRKGRPRISCMEEVTTGMREKGINIMECIDREESRRKIKLQAGKNVKPLIGYPVHK